MATTKKRRKVEVTTLPNGYALTVDGTEYMALNELELAGIVFIHVAVGDDKYADRDMAQNIIEAAANWSTAEQTVMGAANGFNKANEAKAEILSKAARIAELELQIEELEKKDKLLVKENQRLLYKASDLDSTRREVQYWVAAYNKKELDYKTVWKNYQLLLTKEREREAREKERERKKRYEEKKVHDEYNRQWYEANKEKKKAASRDYQRAKREKAKKEKAESAADTLAKVNAKPKKKKE